MDEKYTSKDVLKMAIQAKARGVDMYMSLARSSENYHVAQLFAELAKDEQRHKLEISKWMESLKDEKREEAYPGERSLFLKALVDENTFNCGVMEKKTLETTVNEEDALRAGINFEKDLMLFMHELRRHVAREDYEIIDRLIDEEACHIREMFSIKDKLAGKN